MSNQVSSYRRAHSLCCTGGASAGLDQVVVSVIGGVARPCEGDVSDQLHGTATKSSW